MKESDYSIIIVESYEPKDKKGLHGPIHIRPLPNQHPFLIDMHVHILLKI